MNDVSISDIPPVNTGQHTVTFVRKSIAVAYTNFLLHTSTCSAV